MGSVDDGAELVIGAVDGGVQDREDRDATAKRRAVRAADDLAHKLHFSDRMVVIATPLAQSVNDPDRQIGTGRRGHELAQEQG